MVDYRRYGFGVRPGGAQGIEPAAHRAATSPAAEHRALPRIGPPDFAADLLPGPRHLAPRSPASELRPSELPSPEAAFARASFRALPPEAVFPPPAALVDALADAQRVLVISHTPPDGDCVGTALGMARALQAMGKQACAVVDSPLPRSLAGLDDAGDLFRAADATGFKPDLVLVVDVAQADRIGDAADLLARAPKVAIIDHHKAEPTAQSLGLAPGTEVVAWIDEHAESASLMGAAAVRVLAERQGQLQESASWLEVLTPLAAGAATDTGWFTTPSTRQESLQVFKHLLAADSGQLEGLRQRLAYELPRAAQHHLDRTVRMQVRAHHGHHAVWMLVDPRARHEALRLGQAADPRLSPEDISGALMNRLDKECARHGVAVLLQGEGEDGVRVSIRSRAPEAAGHIARALGGGGKHGAAGVVLKTTLMDARHQLRRVLDQWVLGQSARLLNLGGL
ncbi:MAG: DHH family phosphoesterase [Deltaproteobacteria bacterium]|nr:DHH family phosphoesterase [Deltaproteobacteria bacterium]